MGLDELTVYEEWDLRPPAIPPRSRLFSLEPVGIGTLETESLTGYVARLAEAHGVEARMLVVHEILPLFGRQHLLETLNAGLLSAFWRNETRALNGTRNLAQNLVRALESLTGRQDLRFLTFLTWSEVLPIVGLQRRTRAWCPACVEEWRQAGRPVYEPLLWTLVSITTCPRHRRRLRQVCPHPTCHRQSPWLAPRSRPGYCAFCKRWLGVPASEEPVGKDALAEDEWRTQAWIAAAVGELIAAAPKLVMPPRRGQIVQAITSSVESLVGGNRSAWARELGLPLGTVASWHWGDTVPTLPLLLLLCSRLGTRPFRFLMGDEDGMDRVCGESSLVADLPDQVPRVRASFDREAMRCTLEAVLSSDEQPPPSLIEVARRLGQTYAGLRKHLPGLSRAVATRYLSYQMAQGLAKRQQLCREVRQQPAGFTSKGCIPVPTGSACSSASRSPSEAATPWTRGARR